MSKGQSLEVSPDFFGWEIPPQGVVGELVGANLSDGEVVCLREADHESTHGGVGLHHGGRGQGHADAPEPDEAVEQEVDGDVGQAGIAHGRPDALKCLPMQFLDGQMLVGRISPQSLAHLLVQSLGSCFGQSVGQRLEEHLVVIVVGEGLSHVDAGGGGKDAYLVLSNVFVWTDEVAQAEALSVGIGHLLAQHGQMDGLSAGMALTTFAGSHGLNHDVVPFAPCRKYFHYRLHLQVGLQTLEHLLGFVAEASPLLRLLWHRPCVEEVHPVDVVFQVADAVVLSHGSRVRG